MTPKEKAEELYTRYESLSKAPFKRHQKLKESALIAVDEIFFALKYNLDGATSGSVKYWTEVKQEIKNL